MPIAYVPPPPKKRVEVVSGMDSFAFVSVVGISDGRLTRAILEA